jgi:hypothetical protein
VSALTLPLDTVDCYTFTGQSNCVGLGNRTFIDTPDINQAVQLFNGNETALHWGPMRVNSDPTALSAAPNVSYGPELGFAQALQSGKIIKWAISGRSVTSWLGDDASARQMYDQLLAGCAALNVRPRFAATCWWQYETDSQSEASSAAYQTNFTRALAEMRANIGSATHPVRAARAAGWLDASFAAVAYNNALRVGQLAVAAADPYLTLIDIDDLDLPVSNRSGVHVSPLGQLQAGRKFAGQVSATAARYAYDGQSMYVLDPDYLAGKEDNTKAQLTDEVYFWSSREGGSELLPRDTVRPTIDSYFNGRRCVRLIATSRLGNWDNLSDTRCDELAGAKTPFVMAIRFAMRDSGAGYPMSIKTSTGRGWFLVANNGGKLGVSVYDGTNPAYTAESTSTPAANADVVVVAYCDGTNLVLIDHLGATYSTALTNMAAVPTGLHLMINGNGVNNNSGVNADIRRIQIALATAGSAAYMAAALREDFLRRA